MAPSRRYRRLRKGYQEFIQLEVPGMRANETVHFREVWVPENQRKVALEEEMSKDGLPFSRSLPRSEDEGD